MTACEESIDIAADPQIIFDIMHDYDRRLDWDPFLKEARLLDGATKAGKGVRTWCVARNRGGGIGMETVYVIYKPPRLAAVKMTRGPWLLKSFAATLLHEQLAPSVTRVVYRYHFRPRPYWLAVIFEPLLRAVFSGETRRRLRALKRTVENLPVSPVATGQGMEEAG
jgi:hypothetical protein